MKIRIIATIVILISILVLPYWVYLPAILLGVIFLPFFWEAIPLALLIDITYGKGVGAMPYLVFPTALAILILLVMSVPIRERIRDYA